MTDTLTPIPQPFAPQESAPVWQDNWPSIAYRTYFNHEKYDQVNPEAMRDLMLEMGIPEAEIPKLTVLVGKTTGMADGLHYSASKDEAFSHTDRPKGSTIHL